MLVRKPTILVLLSFIAYVRTKAANSYLIYPEQTREGKTLIDPYEDSPVLAFGNCHHDECTFFRARELSGKFDSDRYLISCSFTFNEGEIFELRAFGSDKIIFTYEVRQNKRFAILNMNSCRTYIARINDDVKMMDARVMWANETTFEISVNNYGHDMVCLKKTCRMVFNEEGDVVKDLHEWIKNDNYRSVGFVKPLGYIVVDANIPTRSLAVYHVNENGDRTTFTNMTSNLIPPVSTTYNYVTTCETAASFIKCVQFDGRGNMTSSITTRRDIKQAKVHNLPGGGYVLLTSRCPKYADQCNEPMSHFFVIFFDAAGKVAGHFTVEEFTPDLYFNVNDVHIFRKDEGGELCFSSVYKRYSITKDKQRVEVFCYKEDHVGFTNNK